MSIQILNLLQKQQYNDDKRYQETVWSDDSGRISMICMKPGQEIQTHTHHGNHIWTVLQGEGDLLTGKEPLKISVGQIVVVPPFEHHGIRNSSGDNLVIASITAQGD